MADLAFHLGSGGGLVGLPRAVGLGGTGTRELGLVGADRDGAAGRRGVHCATSGQPAQAVPNAATPPPFLTGRIATLTCPGQVTVSAARSMVKRSLANRPPSAGGGCTFVIIRARVLQPG